MSSAKQLFDMVGMIREQAAQLLITNADVYIHIDHFTEFSLPDQKILFEESWLEIFIMRIAQNLRPINFIHLLVRYMGFNEPNSEISSEAMFREVEAFNQILHKFFMMRVDSTEYDYLRKIVLYKTDFDNSASNNKNKDSSQEVITSTSDDSSSDVSHNNSTTKPGRHLEASLKVKALECSARDALAQYEQQYYGITHQIRYRDLLSLLPSLKSVSQYTIDELFFGRNTRNTPLINLDLQLNLYLRTKAERG